MGREKFNRIRKEVSEAMAEMGSRTWKEGDRPWTGGGWIPLLIGAKMARMDTDEGEVCIFGKKKKDFPFADFSFPEKYKLRLSVNSEGRKGGVKERKGELTWIEKDCWLNPLTLVMMKL